MKRFRFRLQPLLDVRRQARDRVLAELAEAVQAEAAIVAEVERLSALQQRVSDELRDAGKPGQVDVDAIVTRRGYQLQLTVEQAAAGKALEWAARKTAAIRQRLVQADQQVKVLEQLADKQQQAHFAEHLAREQKELEQAWLAKHLGEP
jgi:flagellar FliJ protein